MHLIAKTKSLLRSRYKSEKIASFVPESDGRVRDMDWTVNTDKSITVMLMRGLLIRLDDGSSICCEITNNDPKEVAEEFEGLDEEVNEVKVEPKYRPDTMDEKVNNPDQRTTEVKVEKKMSVPDTGKAIKTLLCRVVGLPLC